MHFTTYPDGTSEGSTYDNEGRAHELGHQGGTRGVSILQRMAAIPPRMTRQIVSLPHTFSALSVGRAWRWKR